MAISTTDRQPRKVFKKRIVNPSTGQPATNTIYNVIDNSQKLSRQKIISERSNGGDPLEDSLAILSAFGMTVVEETSDVNISLLSNVFLDEGKLEKLTKTQDNNPNRLQNTKFKNLKGAKIPVSDIFNQTEPNPISNLDSCQANEFTAPPKPSLNIIEITDDFIKFSPIPLSMRIKLR